MVLDLLRYVGVVGLTPVSNSQSLNLPGLDQDDINKALAAINSGLQTIQKHGPQDMKYAQRATSFNDPTTVTVTAIVANGQGATLSAPPPQWMMGCSVLISGDSDFNRIMDITGSNLSLLRAYRGPSGAAAATVYADCALLDPTIGAVLEPLYSSQQIGGITIHKQLRAAKDLADFERYQKWLATLATPGRLVGRPDLYIVERRRGGDIFLRLTPMPGSACNVTFQAKLLAERVSESIVDLVGGIDPGYEFTSLQADQVEGLLLPISRWRFFTHPALKNTETRAAVKDEYDETMLTLRNGSVFETSVKPEVASYI